MKDIRDEALYAGVVAQVVARRTELGLSQRELADLCGTTQSAIARFESASRPPKLDTLAAVAEALDCTLEVTFRARTRPARTPPAQTRPAQTRPAPTRSTEETP